MIDARERLVHVIQLANIMPDPHLDILTVKAIDPAGGGHGAGADGMPFHLDMAVDWWNTNRDDPRGIRTRTGVDCWARAWCQSWWAASDYEGPTPSKFQPLLWLHTHIVWALKHFPAIEEFEDELVHVERQLEHATGLSPIPTGRVCPACAPPPRLTDGAEDTEAPQESGQAQGGVLVRKVTKSGVSSILTCLQCGGEFSESGLSSLNRLRLDVLASGKDTWVDRKDARKILGIDSALLRMWIMRGKVSEEDGKVNLKEVSQMAMHSR